MDVKRYLWKYWATDV